VQAVDVEASIIEIFWPNNRLLDKLKAPPAAVILIA
jgi:hypothetical protein